jgi:shikimate kinase
MHPASRVFLVGPMGSGKSTIGRQLAAALCLDFQDSDHEIQRRTGVDIPTIFAFEGEAGFRARERQASQVQSLQAPAHQAVAIEATERARTTKLRLPAPRQLRQPP